MTEPIDAAAPSAPASGTPDAVLVAQQLTTALDGVTASLQAVKQDSEERDKHLAAYGQRNRRMIWALIFSVTCDVLLTIGFGITLAISVHAADRATSATALAQESRASQYYTCTITNQARAENKGLWAYLLSLSKPQPGESATQKTQTGKALTEIRQRVDITFAPRDCATLYSGSPGGK